MRQCIRCGGSLYRDYAYGCEHDFAEPPEPDLVHACYLPEHEGLLETGLEEGWCAIGRGRRAPHPTREGAIALWKERWHVYERAATGHDPTIPTLDAIAMGDLLRWRR